jgi:glycosyltransferase involved in cell wall biosynthesis
MPRKILFLVNTLRVGGAERNVALFCSAIDRTRFEPEVWVLCGGGQFEAQVRDAGIRIRNLNRRWSRDPLFALKTARQIARTDADLVHAFLPAIGAYAAMARSWFGMSQPLVLSLGQSEILGHERWMFRWCARTYDWLIANSRSAAELGGELGFASERISVIPNGHATERFTSPIDRVAVRKSLGLHADDRVLLAVGRLIASKRVCDAVAALDLLKSGDDLKLVIVGDGPERSALEDDVRRRDLQQRVIFTGERPDVPDLLKAADVFVFPSETEGLPNALIEASLAGLPIVACQVPGVTDVLTDGETALLVQPHQPEQLADAISALLSERTAANDMALQAQAQSQRCYSVEKSLAGVYNVYHHLLQSKRRVSASEAIVAPTV